MSESGGLLGVQFFNHVNNVYFGWSCKHNYHSLVYVGAKSIIYFGLLVTIDIRQREGRDSVEKQNCLPFYQEDSESLVQMADIIIFLRANWCANDLSQRYATYKPKRSEQNDLGNKDNQNKLG